MDANQMKGLIKCKSETENDRKLVQIKPKTRSNRVLGDAVRDAIV